MNAGIQPGGNDFVERAKAIILRPKDEWLRIDAEPATRGDILRSWVLPLAAIGPVATLIGSQVFGYGALFVSIKPSLMSALSTAILSYALAIAAVFVLAFIADFLAPKFDGVSNSLNAFKLVAFGATASWLAGIFGLVPALAVFGLLGLYSIYLFYTGAGPLMKVPQDKLVGYTVVTFVAAFVLNMLVGMIAGALIGLGGFGANSSIAAADADEVTVNIPGVGKIDTAKIEQAANRAERIHNGDVSAVPTDTLKAMLPEKIGDFTRTSVSTTAMGKAGGGAEGVYTASGQSFTLRVNDLLAVSALSGIGAAMGIEQSKEDADGYEKVGTVDGQWRTERWNNTSRSGAYGIMVADRFQVEAEGDAPSVETLKLAVATVDADELEGLAE